tara:strand:- start:218 stop:409 length:192 start_codon:yes stop_codon:yes gene_type:complete
MERSELDSISKEIHFETNAFHSSDRNEIRDHLKKLKQIKRDLKRDPKGTPLRKRDRIKPRQKR